jgi:hypothetical protein
VIIIYESRRRSKSVSSGKKQGYHTNVYHSISLELGKYFQKSTIIKHESENNSIFVNNLGKFQLQYSYDMADYTVVMA